MRDQSGMPELRLPRPPDLRIRRHAGRLQVLDRVRHRFVVLTPEEWVRQHAIYLLERDAAVPAGLISVERGIAVNQTAKRYDIVAHDRLGGPWLVVECKRPGVELGQATLDQAATYNTTLRAPYLAVTNGHVLHAWDLSGPRPLPMGALPHFPAASSDIP